PRRAASVPPSPQDVPVLWRQRAQDRLQGLASARALHLRARQDRAEPYHRGVGEQAARAGQGHQACALSGPSALYGGVKEQGVESGDGASDSTATPYFVFLTHPLMGWDGAPSL